MDSETIQQLITTFQELGGDAKEAFIWYVIATQVPGFVIGLTWTIGALYLLARLCGVLVRGIQAGLGISRLRAATQWPLPGGDGWFRDEQWDRLVQLVERHRDKL